MEPITMIVGGLALWNWLKRPAEAARAEVPVEQLIDARIAACSSTQPCWSTIDDSGLTIAPHGAMIPGVDFDLPPWPVGLPHDAVWSKQLATYVNGTHQDLWESPTQGRFIVTTTPEGAVSVSPDLPMSIFS